MAVMATQDCQANVAIPLHQALLPCCHFPRHARATLPMATLDRKDHQDPTDHLARVDPQAPTAHREAQDPKAHPAELALMVNREDLV